MARQRLLYPIVHPLRVDFFAFTSPLCKEAGEGLASRMGSGEEQQQRAEKLDSSNSGAKPGENAEIAQKGEDQFKQGLEQMTGRK